MSRFSLCALAFVLACDSSGDGNANVVGDAGTDSADASTPGIADGGTIDGSVEGLDTGDVHAEAATFPVCALAETGPDCRHEIAVARLSDAPPGRPTRRSSPRRTGASTTAATTRPST